MAASADFDQNVEYLRDVQYRDSTELTKRANVHVAYRTASVSAFQFFASLIDWPDGGRVLDVGCGPGFLWEEIAPALPCDIDLVLTDLSDGMVGEAVARVEGSRHVASVTGRACDARELPLASGSFDVVVSTYALYHVPEPSNAVDEIARVVREGGVVGIMTNGPDHLAEIEAIRTEVYGDAGRYEVNRTFSPAIAASTLVSRFDEVRWHRFRDTLRITDVSDVMAFITSTPPVNEATPDQLRRIESLVRSRTVDGEFVVSKDTGALVCTVPVRDRSA